MLISPIFFVETINWVIYSRESCKVSKHSSSFLQTGLNCIKYSTLCLAICAIFPADIADLLVPLRTNGVALVVNTNLVVLAGRIHLFNFVRGFFALGSKVLEFLVASINTKSAIPGDQRVFARLEKLHIAQLAVLTTLLQRNIRFSYP